MSNWGIFGLQICFWQKEIRFWMIIIRGNFLHLLCRFILWKRDAGFMHIKWRGKGKDRQPNRCSSYSWPHAHLLFDHGSPRWALAVLWPITILDYNTRCHYTFHGRVALLVCSVLLSSRVIFKRRQAKDRSPRKWDAKVINFYPSTRLWV